MEKKTTIEIQDAVENGAKFTINLQKRTLRLYGKTVEVDLENQTLLTVDRFLENAEQLYERYKHSRPSERSESKARNYFRALPEAELSDEDMFFGAPRELARFNLELFILVQLLLGFQWDEEKMGKWFWQSKTDKDLVILRQWFENK